MNVKSATAKRNVGGIKRRANRPKPSAPRAGITDTRYGCGGKLKK